MATAARSRSDVLVLGAGPSGLACADALARANVDVRVIEARDRVGGKTYTPSVEGVPVDLGAHWIGPGQDRMYGLAARLGVEVSPQRLRGRHVTLFEDGRRVEHRGELPLARPLVLLDSLQAFARLELLGRRLDPARPWDARRAERWDERSLEHHRRSAFKTAEARAACSLLSRMTSGAEPEEVSLLHYAAIARGAGGFKPFTAFKGGLQQDVLVGGTQQLCDGLAGRLGDQVVLEEPIHALEHDAGGVRAIGPGGAWEADRCVVAFSPPLVERLDVTPPLPPARRALQQATRMASYGKCVAVFETQWWRQRGLSGLAFSLSGPVQMIVDASVGDGPGILVGYLGGKEARDFGRLRPEERREAAIRSYVKLFGPAAARPSAFVDIDWNQEPYSLGAPSALMGPGTLTRYGDALRRPAGRIHWAGTESAREFTGFMEGAVEAGLRAAQEVLAGEGVGGARRRRTSAPRDAVVQN